MKKIIIIYRYHKEFHARSAWDLPSLPKCTQVRWNAECNLLFPCCMQCWRLVRGCLSSLVFVQLSTLSFQPVSRLVYYAAFSVSLLSAKWNSKTLSIPRLDSFESNPYQPVSFVPKAQSVTTIVSY